MYFKFIKWFGEIEKCVSFYVIFQRSIKLFAIGLCLNSINGPNLENLRIMGVLQRFGIAYLICGVVHTIFTQKEHIEPQVIQFKIHNLKNNY